MPSSSPYRPPTSRRWRPRWHGGVGGTAGILRDRVDSACRHGTARRGDRATTLREMGAADILIARADMARHLWDDHSCCVGSVLDIIGTAIVQEARAATRRRGAVCLVGFRGGGEPLTTQPVFPMPTGRRRDLPGQAHRDPRPAGQQQCCTSSEHASGRSMDFSQHCSATILAIHASQERQASGDTQRARGRRLR